MRLVVLLSVFLVAVTSVAPPNNNVISAYDWNLYTSAVATVPGLVERSTGRLFTIVQRLYRVRFFQNGCGDQSQYYSGLYSTLSSEVQNSGNTLKNYIDTAGCAFEADIQANSNTGIISFIQSSTVLRNYGKVIRHWGISPGPINIAPRRVYTKRDENAQGEEIERNNTQGDNIKRGGPGDYSNDCTNAFGDNMQTSANSWNNPAWSWTNIDENGRLYSDWMDGFQGARYWGSDAIVYFADSGVDMGHPEFASQGTNQICGSANEGQTLYMGCPPGQTITSFSFASYGTPNGGCYGATTSSCHATATMSNIRSACLGKPACTMAASNGNFGDPCKTVNKRLLVIAQCAKPITRVCGTANENQALSLTCPGPTQIIARVDYASYGLPNLNCNDPYTSTSSCTAGSSNDIVRTRCVGSRSCSVPASNSVFGDPCAGPTKRLSAAITCAETAASYGRVYYPWYQGMYTLNSDELKIFSQQGDELGHGTQQAALMVGVNMGIAPKATLAVYKTYLQNFYECLDGDSRCVGVIEDAWMEALRDAKENFRTRKNYNLGPGIFTSSSPPEADRNNPNQVDFQDNLAILVQEVISLGMIVVQPLGNSGTRVDNPTEWFTYVPWKWYPGVARVAGLRRIVNGNPQQAIWSLKGRDDTNYLFQDDYPYAGSVGASSYAATGTNTGVTFWAQATDFNNYVIPARLTGTDHNIPRCSWSYFGNAGLSSGTSFAAPVVAAGLLSYLSSDYQGLRYNPAAMLQAVQNAAPTRYIPIFDLGRNPAPSPKPSWFPARPIEFEDPYYSGQTRIGWDSQIHNIYPVDFGEWAYSGVDIKPFPHQSYVPAPPTQAPTYPPPPCRRNEKGEVEIQNEDGDFGVRIPVDQC